MAVKVRKKFHDIEVPILNCSISVLAVDPAELEGRVMKYDMTRMLRGKNLLVTLMIHYKDEKLTSDITSMKLTHSYIAKMMRNRISYIEDSFVCQLKDCKVRIKPFLLTRKRVHRKVKTALRNEAKKLIEECAKGKTKDDFFTEVIFAKLQKSMIHKLKKIYPLSLCEIRMLKIEKEKEL